MYEVGVVLETQSSMILLQLPHRKHFYNSILQVINAFWNEFAQTFQKIFLILAMIKHEKFHLSWENTGESKHCMRKDTFIKEAFMTFFSVEEQLEITWGRGRVRERRKEDGK